MKPKTGFLFIAGVIAGLLIAPSVHPQVRPADEPRGDGAAASADFVERLLASLSLQEKIGQMIQADIASISPADLVQYPLGSILAGGNAAPGGDIRTTAQAWLDLTDAFQRAATAHPPTTHAAIPILFGIDAVHGHAKLKGATIFPHNVGLGAANDPDLIRRIGEATAVEVAETGIDWTFAPTVAVVRDVRWGRSYESYSESPELVARYAPAMVIGLQGAPGTSGFMAAGHTLSSVKHFVGDGGTAGGRDQGDTVAPEAILMDVHAAGYAPAISAGALIVMASYNSWNGVKLHANHYLITDVLKGRMNFNGFVIGDWNAQEQVPGCTKSDCTSAFLAGIDMLMAPDGWKPLYENTLSQAMSGAIPRERIDDAVRRILRVKVAAGLFGRALPRERSDAGHFEEIGSPAHRALAREAVRKSLVLLKNADHTLPLDPHGHILVAGEAADDIGIQSGGWTIDWQGAHNTNGDFPGGTSLYAGIKAAISAAGGTAELRPDGRYTRKPDAAIVIFGEGPYAEFEGDRETLEYSPRDKRNRVLLRRLHQLGVPTVSVFISGRPLWVNPEINASDAFVAAWLPGSEGGGVADLLFKPTGGAKQNDFTGRLAFSWPVTAMPVTFDERGQVQGALFARGYGLHYGTDSPAAAELPENPHIPARWSAPVGSLFHAGHVTAPWSLFVADGGAEVHVTNAQQASPHGAVTSVLVADGITARWDGSQSAMLRVSGRASDMRPHLRDGSLLSLRYRIDRPPAGRVSLGMRCPAGTCGREDEAMLDVTHLFSGTVGDGWKMLRIPVACFGPLGADLDDVDVPFALEATGEFALTLSEIRLEPHPRTPPARCPAPTR